MRALVTGGAGGIGTAICRTLAAEGWSVCVHYHKSESRARVLADEIGGTAIAADLRDTSQIAAMFRTVKDISLLVNNTGIAMTGLFTETDFAAWRNLFAVNVDSVYHCTQAVLPQMIRAKSGGIINISSIWGMAGASCESAYAASKAAVIGLTKSLALELAPSGIRVNCVAPGAIDTAMLDCLNDAERAALCAETPLGVIGTPQDVADLVAFLASNKARFITGQVISPNGGLVI